MLWYGEPRASATSLVNLMRIGQREAGASATLAASLLFAGCSKASTAVTAPSAAKCTISVTNAPASPFPPNGGNGSISIATTRDCTWSVSADSNWVSVATTSGQGEATVSFTVAANPVPTPRSGALVVSTQRVPLSQAAAPCHFDLNRTRETTGSGGGRLSVDVSTLTGCAWTATSTVNWIEIQSGRSGNAGGTVVLDVSANAGAERVGQVTIAGQTYTVTQNGAAATPLLPPLVPGSVEVAGTVQNISGRCPTIRFGLSGRTVVTNSETEFRNLKCTDVRKGVRLSVEGVAQPDSSILATQLRKID